ncbi:MAG TPA: hypothetical protein VFZ00_20480 [Solirubrobacter sp.]|nr:hypothetical protein [Solirubrobacter sp.]
MTDQRAIQAVARVLARQEAERHPGTVWVPATDKPQPKPLKKDAA